VGHTLCHITARVGVRAVEREVGTCEIAFQGHQSINNGLLKLATLLEGVARGKVEAANGTTSANTGGLDVLAGRIHVGLDDVVSVHVRDMLGIRRKSTVTSVNDGVEQGGEQSVGFLITGNHTDGLDVRVTLVVNASLDAIGQGDATSGLFVLQLFEEIGVLLDLISDETVVTSEVGQWFSGACTGIVGIDLPSHVHVVFHTTALLDPFFTLSDSRRALKLVKRVGGLEVGEILGFVDGRHGC